MLLVTGPESSGTSLVTRMLRAAGGVVAHRSATYPDDWADLPALAADCEAVIMVYRDPFATMASQIAGGLSPNEAWRKLQDGYRQLAAIAHRRVYCLTYEQLVLEPESIRPLLTDLGLDAAVVLEPVTNENVKHRRLAAG